MKSLICPIALLCGLLLVSPSHAQNRPASKPAHVKAAHTNAVEEPRTMFSAEQMTQDLGLNKDQFEKLQSIEADMNAREAAVENLEVNERIAKVASLRAERRKMVASVLTADQNKKLEANIDAAMKARRESKVPATKK